MIEVKTGDVQLKFADVAGLRWISEEALKYLLYQDFHLLLVGKENCEIEIWINKKINDMLRQNLLQTTKYEGKSVYRPSNFIKSMTDSILFRGGTA